MDNCDILIGVLLVIVFVLLVQRTVSPFRCQEGEEEKDGGCVSNSTKDRWWAFWEEPKCKRGELRADYTCLASMIWDAVSPGAASSPQAPAPTPTQNFDPLQYFNRLVGLVERNFLNISTDPSQEFSINIGVLNGCPIDPTAKFRPNVTVKQAFDQQGVKEFQDAVSEFYIGLNDQKNGHGTPDENAMRRNAAVTVVMNFVTTENLMPLVASTLDYQSHKINIGVCNSDSPLRLDEHFVAAAIVNNILMKIGDGISGLLDKNRAAQEASAEGVVQSNVQTAVENRQVDDVVQRDVQTAVEASCKSSGSWADRQNQCCSGRYSVQGLIPGTPGPCA